MIYCDYREHANQQINKICLNEKCNLRSTCCDKCQIESHKSHKQDCISLDQIQQMIKLKILEQKQKQDAIEDIFIRIKHILFDYNEQLQLQIIINKELVSHIQSLKFSNLKKEIQRLKFFYKSDQNQSQEIFSIDPSLQAYTDQLINFTNEFQNVIQDDKKIQNKEQNNQHVQELKQNQEINEMRNENPQIKNIQQQSNVNPQEKVQVQEISDEELFNNLILASAYLEQAYQLFQANNFLEALQTCDSILQLDQTNQEAIFLKINILNITQKFQEIIQFCDSLPQELVNQYILQIQKGEALNQLKKYQEALTYFQQALNLYPDHFKAIIGKVQSLLLLNRFQEALIECQNIDQKHPNNSEIKFLQGYALEFLKQTNQALACYNDAIKLFPLYFKAYRRRSLILLKLKKYNEALNDINYIIQSQEYQIDDYHTKSYIQLQLNQIDEALETCNQGLALEPQYQQLTQLKQQILKQKRQNSSNSQIQQ